MAGNMRTMKDRPLILAIDDQAQNNELLEAFLAPEGYDILTAESGEEALEKLSAHPIDIILLDVIMPGIDGFALTRRIRQDSVNFLLPIILVTALSRTEDRIMGIEAGCDDFISKPIDKMELLARVRSLLKVKAYNDLLGKYRGELELDVARRTEELQLALKALRKSEELFRLSFDNANIGVAFTTLDGKLIHINAAFCALLGHERAETEGTAFSEFLHPDDRMEDLDTLRALLSGELPSARFERRLMHKDGRIVWADESVILLRDSATGEPIFYITHIVDITERKQAEAQQKVLEEQLRAAQKMEAIGSLAGGIAHDFNNLLSVILSYTGFLMKAVPEGDPSRSDLLEVKQAAERAATLTHQLLAFSRKQVLQSVRLDLNQVIKGVAKMLTRILGEDIELSIALEPGLGLVMADPGQIEQVLMNLVVNARDAMSRGGKLTIETSNKEIDAGYAARHDGMAPGDYVMFAVSDSGTGMDKETQARIFEPFFSTKGPGKGTGLGLSTVFGIVKQSGGSIWVYSEPGQGSSFKIYLPRLQAPLAAEDDKPQSNSVRLTGTETILLVEDEEAMRRATERILVGAGYTVLAASDGDEGLEVGARHSGEIHLLLTDVIMPHRGGNDLAQELVKSRPSIKVIFMSGYTDDAIVNHGVLDAGTNFIGKPFTEDALIRKVQEVLTGTAAKSAEAASFLRP